MNYCCQLVSVLLFTACLFGNAAEIVSHPKLPVRGWRCTVPGNKILISKECSNEENAVFLFTAPKWDGKESVWPAFENRSIPKRWTNFDRLAIPLYYDGESPIPFDIFISDSKLPFRKGEHFANTLSPLTARTLILPLKHMQINLADIAIVHCFSENPASEINLYIGDPVLLKPGEPVPQLPRAFLKKSQARRRQLLSPVHKRLKKEFSVFYPRRLPALCAAYLRNSIANCDSRLCAGEFDEELLNHPRNPPFEWRVIQALVPIMQKQPVGTDPEAKELLIGYASSTQKVLPRHPIFEPVPQTVQLDLARNEKEAFQLIVMPLKRDCNSVGIRLTDFSGAAGRLPDSAVTVAPVGFVETTFVPKSGSDYVGFWPDPILSFLSDVTIKAGEAQPFWIKADISANQPAGEYSGNAELTVNGKLMFSIPVMIRVRDFTLPEQSMLPLAVTFWPNDDAMPKCNPAFDPKERNSQTAPVHAWKKHKKEWGKLLSEYYLNIDCLYEYDNWSPSLEHFATLKQQGKLGIFNLGYFRPASQKTADKHGMQPTIDRIRQRYEKAKSLGLLDHAYLYGCDEVKPNRFPQTEQAAAILKKEFPDIPLFSTAADKSYGTDGQLGSIDWFCSVTSKFDEKKADIARKAGKKIWWYICLQPIRPYANIFIESTGIETRLLMGAMAAKYRPDGFLYYQISLWNNTRPITAGPYTNWIAHSFPGYNGDGNWTYPGPDGIPLGSIRLENFRDGLEDYAYVKLLEEQLAAAKKFGKNKDWQYKAEAALKVPSELVTSLTQFSHDPAKLRLWRNRLAELMEAGPR